MLLQPCVAKTAFDEVGFDLVSEGKYTFSDSEEDQTDAHQREVPESEQTEQSVENNNNDEKGKPQEDSSPPIDLIIDTKVRQVEEESEGDNGKELHKPKECARCSKGPRGACGCDHTGAKEESKAAKPKGAKKKGLRQCCSRFYEIDWEEV